MRANVVTCDICGQLLQPTHNKMPWSENVHFENVKMMYVYNGEEVNFDALAVCKG